MLNCSVKIVLFGVLTILGVVFVQYIADALEHAVTARKQSRQLVEMFYKELMVLGVVAFILFVITSIIHIDPHAKHLFEVAAAAVAAAAGC